ncbi:MAG: type II toxin-antitoxin system RelE/ParE family toxin [Lachnospiraceae bacterium]|nr:type II toxin-antitoxin system RelE/ParE family toxin [Lachnospiraceae bacterium]
MNCKYSFRKGKNVLQYKPMQGYKDGRKRLRVGKYRVIYRYKIDREIEILLIMEIGSRGDIYK